jgi:hypothetical protein
MVPSMGFLDKLLGRNKDASAEVAEKAEPVVDKAEDAASQAADTAADAATDVADTAKETVSDATSSGDPPAPSAA